EATTAPAEEARRATEHFTSAAATMASPERVAAALAMRVPVPIVEVAAGPAGVASIAGATRGVDFMTPGEFVMLFRSPPPVRGERGDEPVRFCIALSRGEAMVPRYEDGDMVPVELFEHARPDVSGGDVYLVRLDGHLLLRAIDRIPARGDDPARLRLTAYHPAYPPVIVPVDGSVAFAALG